MKRELMPWVAVFVATTTHLDATLAAIPTRGPEGSASQKPIPWSEVGAAAGAQYSGDGLKVTSTKRGARVDCAFQRLEGEATREGLWLASTVPDQPDERFRVKAMAVGRTSVERGSSEQGAWSVGGAGCQSLEPFVQIRELPSTGDVSVEGQTVRCTRAGLVEEYTVSMDGVQQDFLVSEKPGGGRVSASASRLAGSLARLTDAELCVELAVTGARVERTAYGVELVLKQSGRKIAYSRVKATDASGKELAARMEVANKSEIRNQKSEIGLAVVVDDAGAVYPVRIDPTFSDANWISLGSIPGANGPINVAVVDGAGNLYIGGSFTEVGDAVANNIAKWNGNAWTPLGSGIGGSYPAVYALAVSGSNVYAGGSFTMAGGIATSNVAKWDGSAWSALGSGIGGGGVFFPPSVNALAVLGSDVYAAGYFLTAGDIAANYIAKWDGSTWSALGVGLSGGIQYPPTGVAALAVVGSNVYAGGNFTSAGSSPANFIAKWDGSAWSGLGLGMNNPVSALASSGSDLYAGGDFTTADGGPANYVAKWNGSVWSALGSGPDYGVAALAVSGSDVYAAWNTNAGCAAGGCQGGNGGVTKWNGSTWSGLGSEMGGVVGARVNALAITGGNVYAGGSFTMADASAANYLAKWNGSVWSAIGSGIGGGDGFTSPGVTALAMSGSNLYVGGSFILAGGIASSNVAKWNGSAWSALGSGVGGVLYPSVATLAASASELYVGGAFTTAGGISANYIAKWDGSAWGALGSGMNSSVSALAVSDTNVYAGGAFTTAGGLAANYIAKWDGSTWSALGSGLNGPVSALAVSGGNLYVGGQFTAAGGSPASKIAKWDGNAWSALGAGMDYQVNALAVSGSNLYAGGYFDNAGGIAANYIAKWNGSAWSALGSGVDYYVLALAVSGSDLYAGGNIYTAGGLAANYIVKWDGSGWNGLGSGVNGPVSALAMSGSDLYVGGAFTMAGGKISAYAAKAIIGPPFYFVSTNSNIGSTNRQFYFTLIGPAGSKAVIFASTNLQTWAPLVTNPLSGGSLNFTDTLATNFTHRFYRALLQP